MSGDDHEWRQCIDPACRLRLPVPTADVPTLPCPACGGDLGQAQGLSDLPAKVAPAGVEPARVSQPTGQAVGGSSSGPVVAAGLLDNVRSVRNVGAALRTADAAGLVHVHMVGITASGDHPRIGKTALGAQHAVAWSHHRDGLEAVTALQSRGWQVWALEEGDAAEPLARASAQLHADIADRRDADEATRPHVVVVVGHEVAGVDPAIIAAADRHVAIPMRGTKRSLNVSVAFGIAVYALTTPGRTRP